MKKKVKSYPFILQFILMHFQAMPCWFQAIQMFSRSAVIFVENGLFIVIVSFWHIRKFPATKKKDEGITIDFFDRVSIFLFERCETISKFYFFIKLSFLLLDFCYYVLFDAETRQACHEVEKITMLDPFIWLPSFARGRIWTIHVQAAWPFNFIQSSV